MIAEDFLGHWDESRIAEKAGSGTRVRVPRNAPVIAMGKDRRSARSCSLARYLFEVVFAL